MPKVLVHGVQEAPIAGLPGVGNRWMVQDPVRGTAVLEDFWASVS